MKKVMLLAILLIMSVFAIGQTVNTKTVTVKSYVKKNGTVVQGYTKTTPNKTNWDNYTTKPNTNPTTGTTGYKAKDYTPAAQNYGSGKTIHTGSKGGQYYYNSNGNKTYVPKRK